jgi:hypothetical protein
MQLSAANLLAAQQTAKQAPQPNAPGFASALAAQSRKDDLFAPLDFKQAAPAPSPVSQPRPAQAGAPARAGSMLDIRV